ncbi:hypothetical protein [Amycolatopsis aidingensis]|uniref:hypothetical protein n=1 Tax=Amycolatopsis aidingensis TaxID=2842453 RepID=UPI001C0C3458|nr:hypothetical protein [Amycolatopsis aidingensis]
MGTNSKAAHASYAVAPTAAGTAAAVEEDVSYALHLSAVCLNGKQPQNPAEEALAQVALIDLGGIDPTDPYGPPVFDLPDDLGQRYALLVDAVQAAQHAATQLDDESAAIFHAKLHDYCGSFLHDQEPDALVTLAGEQGFTCPSLVGLSGSGTHPLEHWLDPSYPAEAASKKHIQDVALDRYAALCAGETVGGKTLADWQQTDPTITTHAHGAELPAAFPPWQATADDLAAARAAVTTALAACAGTETAPATPATVHALIDAENTLATAANPDLTAEHAAAVAAARHHIDQALSQVTGHQLHTALAAAAEQGRINATDPQVLNAPQLLKLLRASTPAGERADLQKLAADRATQLQHLDKPALIVNEVLEGPTGHLPALGTPGAYTEASEFVAGAHELSAFHTAASTWNPVDPLPVTPHTQQASHQKITAWAHQQTQDNLRNFCTTCGLLPQHLSTVATKPHLARLLGAYTYADKGGINTIKAQLQKKYDTKLSPPTATGTKPAAPAATASEKSSGSSFGAQHAHMLSALRQAQASYSAVPPYLDPGTVKAWDFGAGTPAQLGGTHPKTLHPGPDGTTWMAKREGTPRGGAMVQAEATASRALARAGLPALPVYATTIGGKPASVQPMLTGASPMPGSPGQWSQADVDAVVRLHVASWALGNHDAHHENVLRTSDGGLIPIDQGQSFKNYGRDKLSLAYRPSTTTVYHRAYDAHLAGTLPKGVRVEPAAAHSVIKRLESIPDAEWRALLRTAAHAGAAHKDVKWVAPMRSHAAQQHGIAESAVTTSQIAEAFLDHAVERKKNLRRDFAAFFQKELKLDSAAALQHLGKR